MYWWVLMWLYSLCGIPWNTHSTVTLLYWQWCREVIHIHEVVHDINHLQDRMEVLLVEMGLKDLKQARPIRLEDVNRMWNWTRRYMSTICDCQDWGCGNNWVPLSVEVKVCAVLGNYSPAVEHQEIPCLMASVEASCRDVLAQNRTIPPWSLGNVKGKVHIEKFLRIALLLVQCQSLGKKGLGEETWNIGGSASCQRVDVREDHVQRHWMTPSTKSWDPGPYISGIRSQNT